MSPARRLAELTGRLHLILGTPGLVIGLFSIVSFGFGLLVLAREYDRLRHTSREALHRVVEGWVLNAPVDDLGLQRAMERNYNNGRALSKDRMRRIGTPWAPWCSVGTWYMWRSLE